jgi:O-acetyl-ADP-ribose deacetylase (regulator of RNase III)
MEPTFKLVLCDPNEELCNEWERAFEPYLGVEVKQGRFEDVDFDCVVSPANSFGLMDGGVDEAITMYFGEQMMERVQSKVIEEYAGEQPIGTSMIVRGTGFGDGFDTKVKYVAHTPTMIIPMDIGRTTNVYMAMKAMLLEIEKFNSGTDSRFITGDFSKIKTVVCPGLGTGAGRVPYDLAAEQMANAYRNVYYNRPTEINWDYAVRRYNNIITSFAR